MGAATNVVEQRSSTVKSEVLRLRCVFKCSCIEGTQDPGKSEMRSAPSSWQIIGEFQAKSSQSTEWQLAALALASWLVLE